MTLTVDTLHVYWNPDDQKHRWSFVSGNGNILADSGQGYAEERSARHGFAILNRRRLSRVPDVELDPCRHHPGRICKVWQVPRRDLEAAVAEAKRRDATS